MGRGCRELVFWGLGVNADAPIDDELALQRRGGGGLCSPSRH